MRSEARRAATGALIAIALTATGGAPAAAQSPQQAEAALERVERLTRGEGVRTGRELSTALLELRRAQGALRGRARDDAARFFARPTGLSPDPEFGYDVAEATPFCTTNFCVHYVESGADAPDLTDADSSGTPDYVEFMASVFEDEVHPCENGTGPGACGLDDDGLNGTLPGLGWREPKADGTLGGDARMDVYIKEIGAAAGGLYGAAITDNGQAGLDEQSAWQVMDDDYDPSEYPAVSGARALRATAAHEYNHAVQFNYAAGVDAWMFESTATAFEDLVYPSVDDYLQYMADWTSLAGQAQPMASPDGGGLKIYASAVWNQWLGARHGHSAVRRAWEVAADPDGERLPDFAAHAYDQAIAEAGGGGFAEEFSRFAAGMAEWRLPSAGFADLFADMPRAATLQADANRLVGELDHTTFALFDVRGASGSATLRATLPAGTSGALALVGRTGGDVDGSATTKISMLPSGGAGAVTLPDAGSFDRVTAVVVNADTSVTGAGEGAWSYARDGQTITAEVVGESQPVVNQPPATVPGPAPPPPPPPAPPPSPAAARAAASSADVVAPAARLKLGRQRLRTVLARGLRVPVTCNEACAIATQITLRARDARRLRMRGVLARTRGTLKRAGTRTLRLRLSRAKRRKLAKLRRVRFVLAVTVADGAGNTRVVRRTVTIRR